MKKILFFTMMFLTTVSFAERVEITYSSYVLGYYDEKTQKNGNGTEKVVQEVGSIIVEIDSDSNMTVRLMNKIYHLKLNSYFTTVNEEKDSVVIFRCYDKRNYQEYVLAAGPEYANFVKTKYWKLSFDVPEKLNQNIQGERDDDDFGIVTGSSFAITRHELITNNHVSEGKNTILINKNPETKKGYMSAYVLYRDPDLDLAVLRTDSNLTSCLIDRNIYDIGEDVYVYGYPQIEKQGTSLKLTKGIISSKRGFRDDVKTYQIDAAVQPGNSGGPLVRKGKIIGVTSARLIDSQNVNYAIKSNFVGAIIDVLGIKNTGKSDPKNCTYFVVGGNE